MEITNDYLMKIAEAEVYKIKDIASPISSMMRMFSKTKQEKALEKCIESKAKIEVIEEIMKYLNKKQHGNN